MIIEGIGTYGIVISTLRIPFSNENYEDIKNLNQVSKIIYQNINDTYLPPENEDIYREYISIKIIIELYPHIFTNEYFMLPIDGGMIDKIKLVQILRKEQIFDLSLSNKSKSYINIISSLLRNKQDMYQITYEKGEKINLDFEDFLDKIKNVFNIIKLSNDNGIFFDDIKLENLIIHNNIIKIIDYSNPINTNTSTQDIITQLENSNFGCVFYYPYPIIHNILLYEFISKIDLIGRFDYKTQNYVRLLGSCFIEFESVAKYKENMINYLCQIYEKNISSQISSEITFEIKVINIDNVDKIECFDDTNLYIEIKNITIYDFINSIKLFYLNNYFDYDNTKSILVKKAIMGSKSIIKKIYHELHEQIKFLLGTINQYSLGMVFLSWLNKKYFNNDIIEKNKIIQILEIIIKNCMNILLLEEINLYYVIK